MSLSLLAHGFGSAADLPVPFPLLLYGAAAAVLGGAAAFERRPAGTPAAAPATPPAPASAGVTAGVAAGEAAVTWGSKRRPLAVGLARLLGALLWAAVLVPAALGADDPRRNPLPLLAYDLLWVVLLPVSFLFGPLWRALNPLRALSSGLARVAGDPEEAGAVALPQAWGVWPAAGALLAVSGCMALAGERPFALAGMFLAYTLVHVGAATVYGARWYARGDGFEVASRLAGGLSPLGRAEGGGITLRGSAAAVANQPSPPGLLGVVAVLVGRHLADGLGASALSQRLLGAAPDWLAAGAALTVGVALAYAVASVGARGGVLAPAFVPVVLAYQVAHDIGVFGVWLGLPGAALALGRLIAFVGGHLLAVRGGRALAVARYGPDAARVARTPLVAALTVSAVGGVAALFGE